LSTHDPRETAVKQREKAEARKT